MEEQQRRALKQALQGYAGGVSEKGRNSHYSQSVLDQLLSQSGTSNSISTADVAALRHQRLLSLLGSKSKNSIIETAAAAVAQQQLAAASLPDPNMVQLQRSLAGDLRNGSLFSRPEDTMVCHDITPLGSRGLLGLSGQQQMDAQNIQRLVAAVGGRDSATIVKGGALIDEETEVRLPCLARGMDSSHDSKTAYFEISSSSVHGQRLRCSYPACRAKGVKFRYCLFCKKPVTKQNFRARHLHADLAANNRLSSDWGAPARYERQTPSQKISSNQESAPNTQKLANEETSSKHPELQSLNPPQSSNLILESKPEQTPEMTQKESKFQTTPGKSLEPTNSNTDLLSSVCNQAIDMVQRRRRWSSLLDERPSGFGNLDTWIADVLAVSDMKVAFDAQKSTLPKCAVPRSSRSLSERSRWNALLGSRPTQNEGPEVNSWLINVLQVSCVKTSAKKTSNTVLSTLVSGKESSKQEDSEKLIKDKQSSAVKVGSKRKAKGSKLVTYMMCRDYEAMSSAPERVAPLLSENEKERMLKRQKLSSPQKVATLW